MFQRFYDIGMCVAFPVGALLFVLAPQIMTVLFGEYFSEGIETLRLLSFLMAVFTMATVFGHIGLIIYGKERVLLYAAIMGAVVNFVLNQLLIPTYSHNGAAMASLISEILVAILLVYTSLKFCRINLMNRKLLISIGITIVLYTLG
jgi:O-antigen/teichoic acid export membrane protein